MQRLFISLTSSFPGTIMGSPEFIIESELFRITHDDSNK